jgi:hypothetical protein
MWEEQLSVQMERRWYIVLKKPRNMFTNTQSSKLVSSKVIPPPPSTYVHPLPHAVKNRIKFLRAALGKAIIDILLFTEEDETINGREKTERRSGEMEVTSRRHVSSDFALCPNHKD